MVEITTIKQRNAHFAQERHSGDVCVFAGATSGIGASTLEKMVSMLGSSTFYVLGRSATRFETQRASLQSLNAHCRIVFIEVELSLLSAVDDACKQIAAAEPKVDYLYMSPGLIPLNGAQYTSEGLETCFAISYYARMRLLSNLLPQLHQSTRPRVLSVLNGGKEKLMYDEDIALEHRWSTIAVVNHTTTMTSLAFDHLAESDKLITFMHACPGLVRTDIFACLTAPEASGILWRVTLASIRGLVSVAMLLMGITPEESGERHAFHLTSDAFGPGAWQITQTSDLASTSSVLKQYEERGWSEKVWEHTVGVFERIRNMGGEAP